MLDRKILNDAVSKYEKDMIKFARDLVAIPGFSTTEEKVAKRIVQEMKKVGFDSVKLDKMGNVIGKLGKGKKKTKYDSH